MNQFKRAKQLRAEAGQTIENITDLKTAGVTTKEDEKNSLPNNISTPFLDKSDNISGNNAQNNIQTENVPIPTTKSNLSTITEQASTRQFEHKNIEMENVSPVTKQISIEQSEHIKQELSVINETIDADLSDNVNIQTESEIVPIEQDPVLEQPPQTIPLSTPHEIPKMKDVPIIIEETASLTLSDPALQDEVNVPIIQPITYKEPSILDTSNQKHSKNIKKSVPNIFTPKGEAKSMRKSLVLKPTSVKIAENYCSKNGGSFNELIQTLLDNFIDEYGL